MSESSVPRLYVLSILVVVVVGAAAGVLYSALDERTESEQGRLEQFIRRAAFDVVDNLGFELFTLVTHFTPDLSGENTTASIGIDELDRTIAAYRTEARFPDLLRDIAVELSADPGVPEATGFIFPNQGEWIRSQGPPYWLVSENPPVFSLDYPVVSVPLPPGTTVSGREEGTAVALHLFIDIRDLIDTVIPTLADRSFSEGGGPLSYGVSVLNRNTQQDHFGGLDIVVPLVPWGQIRSWMDHYRVRSLGESRIVFGGSIGGDPVFGEKPEPEETAEADTNWYLGVVLLSDGIESHIRRQRILNAAAAAAFAGVLLAGYLGLAVAMVRVRRTLGYERSFTALVSHELKTPLAVIGSLADNLSSRVVSDPGRVEEYAREIRRETDRLGTMIGNILSLSALRGNLASHEFQYVRINETVKSAVDAQMSAAGDRRIGFVLELDDSEPCVIANESFIRAVLDNLLANAIAYGSSPDEDRRVWVKSIGAGRDGRGFVTLVVADEGSGVPVKERRKVFVPYYRGAEAAGRKPDGSGLGLSLVRSIVRSMGGSVVLSGRPRSCGAVFSVRIPVNPRSPSGPRWRKP